MRAQAQPEISPPFEPVIPVSAKIPIIPVIFFHASAKMPIISVLFFHASADLFCAALMYRFIASAGSFATPCPFLYI